MNELEKFNDEKRKNIEKQSGKRQHGSSMLRNEFAPIVSFILPIYNEQLYISQCLDSIIKYTDNDFEICISDNCSSDESWQIVLEYAKKHKFIKAKRVESSIHLYSNYCLALEQATGDYIVHIGGDDYITNEYVMDAISKLENNPNLSWVVPRIEAFSDRFKTVIRTYPLGQFENETREGIFEPVSYFLNNVNLEYMVCGGVFRADMVKKLSMLSRSTCEPTASWYVLYAMLQSKHKPINIEVTIATSYMKRYDKRSSDSESTPMKVTTRIPPSLAFIRPIVWRLRKIIGSVGNSILFRRWGLINNKEFLNLIFSDRHEKSNEQSFVMKGPAFRLFK